MNYVHIKNVFKVLMLIVAILVLQLCVYSSSIVYHRGKDNQNVDKYDRVAVVGNSHASLFSYFNNIDRDDSIEWQSPAFSNNAAGSDTIDSIIKYPGTNIPIFKSFITKAQDYDYAIIFIGTNDLNKSEAEYSIKLENFLNEIITLNPDIKILLMEIPPAYDELNPNLFKIKVPLFNDIHKNVADKFNQVEYIDYDGIDLKLARETGIKKKIFIHLSYDTYIALWQKIKDKYNLNIIMNHRKVDDIIWNELVGAETCGIQDVLNFDMNLNDEYIPNHITW